MPKTLITGGAGYIGSHTVLELKEKVIVVDNLSTGFQNRIPDDVLFFEGDVGDELVEQLIKAHHIDTVIHFAGSISVSESITNPLKYYQNNVNVSQELIKTCMKNNVKNFVFSSSAAVYGMVHNAKPITEDYLTQPINPYGTSKLVIEWMLRDAAAASSDFNYVSLRYFNAAGAGHCGQMTDTPTHLIEIASSVALGKRKNLEIFGTNYHTKDGTCIRDYVHVSDLAEAHLLAIEYLKDGGQSNTFNLGSGHGFSVREIINTMKQITGKDIPVINGQRRNGDPESLVADIQRAEDVLGWKPKSDLDTIISDAWNWHA